MTGTKTITIPFWATLLTILGVIILCSLGTWQLQRLAWKNELITKLENSYNASGKNVLDLDTINSGDLPYGRVKGQLLTPKGLFLGYETREINGLNQPGKILITPLKTESGNILIQMGWWPLSQSNRSIYKGYRGEEIWLEGLIKKPSWNVFTPDNDPPSDIWYKIDTEQIAEAKNIENLYPFILVADKASPGFSEIYPNNERWEPNNNHAQYALFWFTLAGALIIIYWLRFIRKTEN